MEHISANSQVTIVEGIELGPTLRAELSTTQDQRVEHDQTEDQSLKLIILMLFGFVIICFVEFGHSTTQVGFQVLRSLI